MESEGNDFQAVDFTLSDNMLSDDILQSAREAQDGLLPVRSKERYLNAYNVFVNWQRTKNTMSFTEPVLLAYFFEKAKTSKASTLWSIYSMLKGTILCKEDVDISKYSKLIAFLKRKLDGYTAKKSKVFTPKQIQQFMNEAPDDRYLVIKVCIY